LDFFDLKPRQKDLVEWRKTRIDKYGKICTRSSVNKGASAPFTFIPD
jgi:hypothetical protein